MRELPYILSDPYTETDLLTLAGTMIYATMPVPPGTGNATSSDGVTWSYNVAAPSWVTSKTSPSGDVALFAADVVGERYWISGSVPNPLGPFFFFYAPNGAFDPAQDWINGTGLEAVSASIVYPTFNQFIFSTYYPGVTLLLKVAAGVPASGVVGTAAWDDPAVNGEGSNNNTSVADGFTANTGGQTNGVEAGPSVSAPPAWYVISTDGASVRYCYNGGPVQSVAKLTYDAPFTYLGLLLQQPTPILTEVWGYPPQTDANMVGMSTPV